MTYVPVEWRDAGPGRMVAPYRGATLEAWTYGQVGKFRVIDAETGETEATGETYSPGAARGAARETWDRILRRREVTPRVEIVRDLIPGTFPGGRLFPDCE